jgi:hypothetical protein
MAEKTPVKSNIKPILTGFGFTWEGTGLAKIRIKQAILISINKFLCFIINLLLKNIGRKIDKCPKFMDVSL